MIFPSGFETGRESLYNLGLYCSQIISAWIKQTIMNASKYAHNPCPASLSP